MNAAVIQMCSGDTLSDNLAAAGRLLAQAASAGAVLAVLPENFPFMGAREADKLRHAERPGDGPVQDFLIQASARLNLWIVGGTVPIAADGEARRVFAACLVAAPQGGIVARYDKMHLFDVDLPGAAERYRESATICPGTTCAGVLDTPLGRLGLSVCYDLRFPEFYRQLVAAGAELLAVPSAFTRRTGEAHWEILLRARAIENQCYVLASNQGGGHPGGRETYGGSMIVDPWGTILSRAPSGEAVVSAAVDREQLHALRRTFPALQHRRIEA